MKKSIFYALLPLALLLGACSKDEKNDETVNPAEGRITCKVNGKAWTSESATKTYTYKYTIGTFDFQATFKGTEAELFGDTLDINGVAVSGTDTQNVRFSVVLTSGRTGNYTIGTFPQKNSGTASAFYYNKLSVKNGGIGFTGYTCSGSLNISSWDETNQKFNGSFSFNMTPKNPSDSKTPAYTVTSGNFTNLSY